MNIMLVIPQYPLLFVVAAFIGEAGPLTISLIIGCTSWAWGLGLYALKHSLCAKKSL